MNRAEWLELRRQGLGGSDIAGVAGIHPYRTPWSVYWDKVSETLEPDEENEAALWGRLAEPIIADEWSRRDGRPTITAPIMRHPDHEWWLGSVDRLVLNAIDGAPVAVLEVKNPGEEAWRYSWHDGTVIPAYFEAQVQWYLGMTDLYVGYFAVLVGGRRLLQFRILRNDKVIDALAASGERFWRDHVLRGVPPEVDGSADTRDELAGRFDHVQRGAGAMLSADAAELVTAYRQAQRDERTAADAKGAAANGLIDVLASLGAEDGYLFGDDDATTGPAVTYRTVREVDWEALEATGVSLDPYRRTTIDTKAAEAGLGRATVEQYRKPSERRRLYVRRA